MLKKNDRLCKKIKKKLNEGKQKIKRKHWMKEGPESTNNLTLFLIFKNTESKNTDLFIFQLK